MGHDGDDKSFLGKLMKYHGKLEDGVLRRMEENERRAQAKLSNNMEGVSLQQPQESTLHKSQLSESSYVQNGQQSAPTSHGQQQYDDKPPQYQQQHPGNVPQPDIGPNRTPRKSLDKPVPSKSREMESFSSAATTTFATKFASLSLHMTDRIRLLEFPPQMIEMVRLALHQVWRRGIQEERDYYGSYESKLRGNPWTLSYGTQGVESRRLTRCLFELLYDSGWVLALGTDVSIKTLDKDTLIFRHQIPSPAKCDWITVDFIRGDRIRILDAPKDLLDAVFAQLKPAIQEIVRPIMSGVWEIKMLGYPWSASGGETMKARRLLLQLFAVLERFGFTVYASIDQESTTSDSVTETDVWQCLRPVGWTPGAPVYHA